MKTALILPGCGARVIIQAGMIKAFLETGIKYDALYGVSAGSLSGAFLHQGEFNKFLDILTWLSNKDLYTFAPWLAWGPACSFFDTAPLKRLLDKHLQPEAIVANPIPFKVAITNLTNGTGVIAQINKQVYKQYVKNYIMASVSIPVLFPVQRFKEWVGADGGVKNDFCVQAAVMDGMERLIVLTPMFVEPGPLKSWQDAAKRFFDCVIAGQLEKELQVAESKGVQVIRTILPQPTGIGLVDFNYGSLENRQKYIKMGSDAAKLALKGIMK